jgi:hypothetical protein
VSAGDARYLYAVRCNFTGDADDEVNWNAWYSGPKLAEMLRKPMFVSVQRLIATGLDRRRRYLALWLVTSPDALTTPEYRAQWGFGVWAPKITDWSRDLYRASPGIDALLDLGDADTLYLASFDGLAHEAAVAHLGERRGDTLWLDAVGLDRHAPILGLRRVARAAPLPSPAGIAGLNETMFQPITPRLHAAVCPPPTS